MTAALDLRVSTSRAPSTEHRAPSTEHQLPDLEALASRRGFDIVQTFCENVSAVKARSEFHR